MASRRDRLGFDALYARSLLATMGGLLLGAAAFLCVFDADGPRAWPASILATIGAVALVGLLLVTVSILTRDRTATRWAEAWSVHEAVLVPMLLAWPLYRLLKALSRR